MSGWEYGIEFEMNDATSVLEFAGNLPAAVGRAQRMQQRGEYDAISLVRRWVGDWEPFCIKDELGRNTQ